VTGKRYHVLQIVARIRSSAFLAIITKAESGAGSVVDVMGDDVIMVVDDVVCMERGEERSTQSFRKNEVTARNLSYVP
jgi:hypothetical protein